MKSKAILSVIILCLATIEAFSQKGFSTVEIWQGELKGMRFKAKIDYKPDCAYTTPFVRATLHSIEVESFEYKGENYTQIDGISFPITVTGGYLEMSMDLHVDYYGNKRYSLKKAHLSTSIGGTGYAMMADEFRFVDGEVTKLKEHLEVSGCSDLLSNNDYVNAHFTETTSSILIGDDYVLEGGNFEYKNNSLHSYLANKVDEMLDRKEKAERYEAYIKDGDEYASSGDYDASMKSYRKALNLNINNEEAEKKYQEVKEQKQQAEEEAKKQKETEEQSKSEEQEDDEDSFIAQEKAKAKEEMKRIEAQQKNQKIRLSREELARINKQVAYNNRVNELTNTGINSQQAHKMAQNESKIQMYDDMGNAAVKIGHNLLNAHWERQERKEEEHYARVRQIKNYRDNFRQFAIDINKANKEKIKILKEKVPIYTKSSDNPNDLKQEILYVAELVYNNKRAVRYAMHPDYYMLDKEGWVILETELIDAYFEGTKFYTKVVEKCKEASYDKDHLNTRSNKAQPAKYNLEVISEYDFSNNEIKVKKRIVYNNGSALPVRGYLIAEDFRTKIKNIDDTKYLKNWSLVSNSKNIYPYNSSINKKLNELNKLYKQVEIDAKTKDKPFMESFQASVSKDLESHYELFDEDPIYLSNTKFTNNPDEVTIIRFWDDKYLIMSFPGSTMTRKLLPSKTKRMNGSIAYSGSPGYVTAKSRKIYQNKFRGSYLYGNAFIGGNSNKDLLLSGQQPASITQYVSGFYYGNNFVKDIGIPSDFSSELWLPYVEVGRYKLGVEYKYINDEKLKESLKKRKIESLSIPEYRSNPEGLSIQLAPYRRMAVFPTEKSNYKYVDKVKAEGSVNGSNIEGQFLYFQNTNSQLAYGVTISSSIENSIRYKDLVNYEALQGVSALLFSDELMNSYYDFITESKTNSQKYYLKPDKPKGSVSYLNYMFQELATIDFSPKAIKYGGRTPVFYDNGNLKEVGSKVDGKKTGKWEYYNYQEQKVKVETFYSNFPGTLNNVYKYNTNEIAIERINYNVDNSIMRRWLYNPDTKSLQEIFYSNGMIDVKKKYKARSLDDTQAKIIQRITYKDGLPTETKNY